MGSITVAVAPVAVTAVAVTAVAVPVVAAAVARVAFPTTPMVPIAVPAIAVPRVPVRRHSVARPRTRSESAGWKTATKWDGDQESRARVQNCATVRTGYCTHEERSCGRPYVRTQCVL